MCRPQRIPRSVTHNLHCPFCHHANIIALCSSRRPRPVSKRLLCASSRRPLRRRPSFMCWPRSQILWICKQPSRRRHPCACAAHRGFRGTLSTTSTAHFATTQTLSHCVHQGAHAQCPKGCSARPAGARWGEDHHLCADQEARSSWSANRHRGGGTQADQQTRGLLHQVQNAGGSCACATHHTR